MGLRVAATLLHNNNEQDDLAQTLEKEATWAVRHAEACQLVALDQMVGPGCAVGGLILQQSTRELRKSSTTTAKLKNLASFLACYMRAKGELQSQDSR